MNESDFRECRKRCRRCVCLYSLWAGSCSSVSAYHDLVQQKEVWQSLFYYKKQSYDHLCGRSRTSDIVFEGIRNCRQGGSDFFQSSGGIFGLYDSVDRKCIIVLPAGILCPWMWKQMRNWKRSFLLGFAGSLLIETLQMLTGRGLFQLDDLITNAVGMMAGYGIYQIAKKLWKRVYKSRFQ